MQCANRRTFETLIPLSNRVKKTFRSSDPFSSILSFGGLLRKKKTMSDHQSITRFAAEKSRKAKEPRLKNCIVCGLRLPKITFGQVVQVTLGT